MIYYKDIERYAHVLPCHFIYKPLSMLSTYNKHPQKCLFFHIKPGINPLFLSFSPLFLSFHVFFMSFSSSFSLNKCLILPLPPQCPRIHWQLQQKHHLHHTRHIPIHPRRQQIKRACLCFISKISFIFAESFVGRVFEERNAGKEEEDEGGEDGARNGGPANGGLRRRVRKEERREK